MLCAERRATYVRLHTGEQESVQRTIRLAATMHSELKRLGHPCFLLPCHEPILHAVTFSIDIHDLGVMKEPIK